MDDLVKNSDRPLKPRFQFRLRTALIITTVLAMSLGAGVLMPPRLRQLTGASLVLIGGSAVVFAVLWLGERFFARFSAPRPLAIGSMMLTSISVFVILLILMRLPGGGGDVQLWVHNETAMFVFAIRGATILVLPFSTFFCGLIGKVRLDLGMPARFGWLIAAIAVHVLAWYMIGAYQFFPTV